MKLKQPLNVNAVSVRKINQMKTVRSPRLLLLCECIHVGLIAAYAATR